MIFFIRFKEWVVVITKYEKKQAILVDFRLFFLMRLIITLPIYH